MDTGVRVEWHLKDMTSTQDPFGSVVYSGLEIDLTGTDDELFEACRKLLRAEARLARTGLTCELKDGGQDCLTCPVATLDAAEARSRLCRVGKDQETVERLHNERYAERRGLDLSLLAMAEEFSALGHMDEDDAELLTQVGL